jgi:acyl-CoA reductase-like NAD-dependent aldehyde dehydrogenase
VPTTQVILRHKRHTIVYRPLGVVGVISAWNYPLLVPVGPVGMALVAGNAVVFKPSEWTPLVGDLLASVFAEAGLPDGVLRVVHGEAATGPRSAAPIDREGLLHRRRCQRTEGTEAGEEHGKPVVLELGGKDPAIVCHDADLDRAVAGTLWAATAGAGRLCGRRARLRRPARALGLPRAVVECGGERSCRPPGWIRRPSSGR